MTPSEPIYLDYQATTPVDQRVVEQMLPYFGGQFGNPASVQHEAGRAASAVVESAREHVAHLIGADRREIVFCSGATEANNLALNGLGATTGRDRIVVLATEHAAVLEPARVLARAGYELVELRVDREGQPSQDELRDAIDDHTLLVSVAAANNEIGTLPPLAEIGRIAHSQGAYFHTDAAQAAGKVSIDVERDAVDLLSLSAHKLYGPKGIGALYVRGEVRRSMTPLIDGGGQERGLRGGTLNVPGIVGFGAAAELAASLREEEAERLRDLSDLLLRRLCREVDGVEINGPAERLPGNLSLRFIGVDAEALIANCPEIAISAGSACSAATPTPSHVLTAIGLNQEAAEQSVRIGIGRPTTAEQVDRAAAALTRAVERVRAVTSAPRAVEA